MAVHDLAQRCERDPLVRNVEDALLVQKSGLRDLPVRRAKSFQGGLLQPLLRLS